MRTAAPRARRAPRSARALALLAAWLWLAAAPRAAAQGEAAPPVRESPLPAPQDAPRELPLVQAVRVEGNRRYTPEQLVAALGQPAGRTLDPRAVEEGVKRLWRQFRVRASVVARELDQPGPAGQPAIDLVLRVEELPSDREPRFVGNDAVDVETLERWALLENRTELFLHQARRVRRRLLEGYARDGFYWAEVNIVTRGESADEAALSDVIFEIREGPKVRVREVVLHGNRSMPDRRSWLLFKEGLSSLAKRELKGPTLFNWFGSVFVREKLDADVQAMRTVYRDRGWLDAVVEVERLEFSPERDRVEVHVAIDEGPRYKVGRLSIEGVEARQVDGRQEYEPVELAIPADELLAKCKLQPGEWFERNLQERDAATLRDAWGELGHLSHPSLARPPFPPGYSWEFLEPATTFDVERHTVDVVYRIVQGRRLVLREIQFAGTTHTRDRVLRREVSVFPGQQADLSEINRSLARIQGTGFFSNDIDFEHRDPYYRFLPVAGDPGAVDLVFDVQEGRVIDFSISGGVDSNEGAFGLVSLSMRNFDIADTPRSVWSTFSEIYDKEAFHGAGQRLDIELSPGTVLSRYRLHFLEPDLFRLHLNPISLDLDLTKRVRRYDTHDEDRLSLSARVGRKFTQALSMSVGFATTEVEVDNLDEDGVPPLLAQQDAFGQSTVAGPTYDLMLRELDNFISPQRGYQLRWNNALSGEDFGADYEFLDSQLHLDVYRPLWAKADGTRVTLHLELDGGVAPSWGATDDVPYTERYFLGGSRTLRGFDFRGIGPFDPASGFPLGGETYASGSLELYYPLHSVVQPGSYARREMLRGILFSDFGALDPEPYRLDPSDLRMSVGFGVGLAYPLPLSLNFGFPVLEKDGDDKRVFSFSLALF